MDSPGQGGPESRTSVSRNGGMRRTLPERLENVQKRCLLHAVAYNPGVLMRHTQDGDASLPEVLIGCDPIAQDMEIVTLLCLEEPVRPPAAITGKLERKILPVAPVGDVPGVSGHVVAIGSGHDLTPSDKKTGARFLRQLRQCGI